MKLEVEFDEKAPVYLQIKQAIADQIQQGVLPIGARLPATRDLAHQLGVNRGTVTMAYDELVDDGYLESHVGRGTFVARRLVTSTAVATIGQVTQTIPPMTWEGIFADHIESPVIDSLLDLYQVSMLQDVISFSGSFPDSGSFPAQEFQRSLNTVIDQLGNTVLAYGPAQGFDLLREFLAREMTDQGISVSPDQILITNGSQQALDLIARAFLSPGDTVVIENPTYPGAVNAFTLAGAHLIGIPIDEHGIRTEAIEKVIEFKRPKLIYTVPSFQNPTGVTLSLERRHHLLNLAWDHGIPIVEDDYGSCLSFDGAGMPILKTQDAGDHVIYVNTFSKSLLPGLRLGWCAAAKPVISRLTALKQNSDISSSTLLQAALWEFCQRGQYQAHLERVRPLYRERRDRVIQILGREFPKGTTWTRPNGGLFLWVTLPEAVDATELLYHSRQKGVVFSRGHLFYAENPAKNTLRLSYGNVSLDQIETGLSIIGRTAQELVARSSERTPVRFRTHTVPLV